ncbi:ABC transporter ATP-binding protein [Arthrobacter sp. M4]|uniref:ABC transporter ATP-binding protein n=1 Tax=Arthrobacter sp. M4 TaxID=218160 RepID=UPI001CDC9785|nr:ATP-binding cassette domain-containing protein [Arthrobacter sp. M4]MCA4134042.1 ATP-binding cassette domain-containing protein [Arthrobacter sp. M4]
MSTVLTAQGLTHSYKQHGWFRRPQTKASLKNVSLNVPAGSSIGLVGGSGAGKSTLLRALLALEKPDAGTVAIGGQHVKPGPASKLRWYRRLVQYVPQNPAGSLNPAMTVRALLLEPLRQLRIDGDHEHLVRSALERVSLEACMLDRKPTELSGGQNQRVAIARALTPGPRILLADEPVSGLDLPLRNSVLDLLHELVSRDGLGLLFVSHDLAAVSLLCPETIILSAGHIVEQGPTAQLFADPQHAHTRELIASIPTLERAQRP